MMQQRMENQKPDGAGYRVGTRTHIGLRRKRNEDFLGIDQTPNGLLLVVCDGMGGHAGGDRASRLAVDVFTRSIREGKGGEIEPMFRQGVEQANRAIHRESIASEAHEGMGTTLVAALLQGDRVWVANVGDSRAYLLHAGKLGRITHDHSLVGEMVAQGKLTEDQAAVHPQRNIITRALGTDDLVEPDIFPLTLVDGDALLLSTDGLHGLVPDAEIEAILGKEPSAERACDLLVDAALAAGGSDNVTVALLRVGSDAGSGGPITDPATIPPVVRKKKEDKSRLILWVILILGITGVILWGLDQFGSQPEITRPDSTLIFDRDSLGELDSLSRADSLQPDSIIRRVDSAGHPIPDSGISRQADTPVKDLSGTYGSNGERKDSGRSTRRSGRR
jgi:protein phosphatase